MAQLVKRLTLDFGSGHDLKLSDQAPREILCSVQSLLEVLSSFPSNTSLPHLHALTLFEINKSLKTNKKLLHFKVNFQCKKLDWNY